MFIANDEWRIPDQAASFLFADRDVCRKVFHREPLDRVVMVIDWILFNQDVLSYDLEGELIEWAIEYGAGVYGPNRRQGDLESVGEILYHEISYGVLSWIETERPGLTYAEECRIYFKRLRDKEENIGRQLTPSELDAFTRAFYAADYRKDLEKVSQEQWEELREELEERKPRTDQDFPFP